MGIINHYGQPTYFAENASVKLLTTIQNACTTPYFKIDGREIGPYWIAPWWKDSVYLNGDNILSTLRGNFICAARTEDGNNPEHGWCCALPWELKSSTSNTDCAELVLSVQDRTGGTIEKTLRTNKSATAVYEQNRLCNFDGEYSIGNHPCLKLPKNARNGYFSMTPPEIIVTPFLFCESPGKSGYELFPRDTVIEDIHHVKTIYEDYVDLAHHPAKPGTIEILAMQHKSRLVFAAFVNMEEGYVYYQLKNSKYFPFILFWMFSGGRHYAPWNGTQEGCLGVEDGTNAFPFVHIPKDPLAENNTGNTGIQLKPDKVYQYRQIYGVEKLPEGFKCVENVEYLEDGIVLAGNDNIQIHVQVNWKFLE
jgi:hypothetical protein